ncbi:MAG TPA: hypothetical protein VK433_00340 [Stellaceae bacterium]|nr:hypothetical protein [Stellaceae bacterium]
MIYNVRWNPADDAEEYRSRNHSSADEAMKFACTILDQMKVRDIRIMDMSGQQIAAMPEIVRHWKSITRT